MSKAAKVPHSIIAVARDDGRFKAVEVRRHEGGIEILWARSLPVETHTWMGFATECGLNTGADERSETPQSRSSSVVGLDSTGVAFYRLSAPRVGSEETAAIVRMQAEALLPLPPDQIEVAWRTSPSTNGKVDITIAAARREYLQKFVDHVSPFRPRRILLSCEGMAKAWQTLFADRDRQALVVGIGVENTQICLVQNGQVMHAAVLDTGMADLGHVGSEAEPGARAEVVERFAQDLRTILCSFGWDESSYWPVFVLSDGNAAADRVVESLNAAGLHARATAPETRNLRMPRDFAARDIYEYRIPLGLALVALEGPAGTLDLFERISWEREQQRAKSSWYSVAVAGAAAAVLLLVLVVVWRYTDVALARRLDGQIKDPAFAVAVERQALLKTVARHRPDLLELLTEINAGPNDGIVLDSVHFRKGQKVAISGQAGNADQMYKFQAGLLDQKGIDNVNISNSATDTKTKKVKFTMTFDYRTFTKKEAAL